MAAEGRDLSSYYADYVIRQYDSTSHEPLKVLDETLGTDWISKRYTKIPVPKQLRVKRSTISDAGLGVFATELIPKGTKMGPYKGVILQESDIGPETDCRYVWEVKQLGGAPFYIDGKKEKHTNWMRFVNCARDDEEQNLVAFQYENNIYYSACQEIMPGTELLTWYGTEFATKGLGLSVDSTSDPNYLSIMTCDASTDTDKCEQTDQEVAEAINDSISACETDCGTILQHIEIIKRTDSDASLDLILISDSDDEIVVVSSDEESLISVGDYADIISLSTDSLTSSDNSSSPSASDDSLPEMYFLKDKNFPCKQCGQSFSSQEQATAHIKCHPILHNKPFCCQYCGKSFKHKAYLQQHTTVHTRPFPCQYCNKSFTSKPKVDRHMKFHGIIRKPHQCHICSASFFYEGYLRKHIKRNHPSEEPHLCQYCGKAFVRNDMLLRHTRLHTVTEKPFYCQQCGKSFAQPGYLSKHLKVHLKPYQCQYCNKRFSLTHQLKRHIAKKHTS